MKTLKILLSILAIVIVAILIIAMIAPKQTTVQRSVAINAPAALVMEEVNSLEDMANWSPWAKKDPDMTVSYEGNMGAVGSVSRWEGNKDVGKGEQKITAIGDNKIETHLTFFTPWGTSEADAFIQVDSEDEASKATWSITAHSPFPWNALSVFMNMDDMIGKDFEEGLNNLKTLAETKKAQEPAYVIEVVDMPQKVYIAKKDSVSWTDISTFFQAHLPAIYEGAGKSKVQPAGPATGIFYNWDEANQSTIMAAAVPVTGDEKTKMQGYETIVMPAGRALKLVYYGPYEGSEKAHMAMDKYIKDNAMEQTGPVIEEYITDPTMEKDTSKWQTIIYYPVK